MTTHRDNDAGTKQDTGKPAVIEKHPPRESPTAPKGYFPDPSFEDQIKIRTYSPVRHERPKQYLLPDLSSELAFRYLKDYGPLSTRGGFILSGGLASAEMAAGAAAVIAAGGVGLAAAAGVAAIGIGAWSAYWAWYGLEYSLAENFGGSQADHSGEIKKAERYGSLVWLSSAVTLTAVGLDETQASEISDAVALGADLRKGALKLKELLSSPRRLKTLHEAAEVVDAASTLSDVFGAVFHSDKHEYVPASVPETANSLQNAPPR